MSEDPTAMSVGAALRRSPTGILNEPGQNVCWLAPSIHILLRDPALSDYLLDSDVTVQGDFSVQSVVVMLANQFANHSQAEDVELLLDVLSLSYPEFRRVNDKGVRKRVQEQIDWADGLSFLLEALTGAAASTKDKAMVTLMFQWSVQTFLSTGETRCVTSKLTGTAQPGWVLQLPINGSIPLDAALEDYFFAKPLLGDDGGELGQESARLCRLPTTLVIALKRVRKAHVHGGAVGLREETAVKSAASMHYPMQLSMAKYCTSGALADGWGGVYTLGGVVLHQGSSGDAGHYTFLQKQPDSNIWVLFDDSKTPKARTPNQVLGFRQLACGFVYHRTPPPRAQAQPVDAAGNTRPAPLYESIPRLCQSEGPASSEVPAVVTALTTLPALGTAKHMLSQQQQADLSERQAAFTAQRKAAAELQLHQLARQAQADKALRRSKKEEERQAEQNLVEGAKQRQQAAEARKVQRLAREQAAHEQQSKAAQAAATRDAARYRAGAESQPIELPASSQAAPLSKKERAQARLAAKKAAKAQEKAEEAASAAAARQLIDAAAQQQQEAEVAAAVKQEASAAQQQAEADAAASQYAATVSAAAAQQADSQSHMAADQLLKADLAVFAELAANDAIAAAQQEIEPEASAAELYLEAAAPAIKHAAAQQHIEAEAAAAAAITLAAAQQQIEAEAAAAAAIKQAAATQRTEVEAAANAEQADAEFAEGLEDPVGSLKGQGPDSADAAVRLKANLPGNAEKQAKQTAGGAANAAKDQLIKAAHANNQ
ncbi:Ubiquitin carboxyl-terminal hydrolase 34 [Trebouxia sp. C0010 RCD-2024]